MSRFGTIRGQLDRSAMFIGIGAVASPLLGLSDRTPPRLIAFGTIGVLVTIALGVSALIGGYFHLRPVAAAAGLGFLVASVLQTDQLALGADATLGGDGSTIALHLGFSVGLLSTALVRAGSSADQTMGDTSPGN